MTYITYVYGHSDDCVEIEGGYNDELYVYDDWKRITVGEVSLDVTYDGEWSFEVRSTGGSLQSTAVVLPQDVVSSERFNDYTEVVVIKHKYK